LFGRQLVNLEDVMNHYAELMLEDEYTDFPEKLASVCAEVVHNKTDCVVALNFADIDFNELQTDLLQDAPATCYQWDLEEIKCLFWSVWLAMRSKFTAHVVILNPDNVGALCETYFLYCKYASPMHDELALGNDLAYKMYEKFVLPAMVGMRHYCKDYNLCCVCSTRKQTKIGFCTRSKGTPLQKKTCSRG